MKHLIILGDGMADWPVPSLGGKTLLQYAHIPTMDQLARMGRNGMLHTVPEGFHPGSEVANLSVLGYNLPAVYEGRGVLEAASMGVELQPDEMAMRCNLICIEGDCIKNHSAGHITTPEADELIQYLQAELADEQIRLHTGVQYRHLLVVKNGNKQLTCTPPHDVPLQPFRPLLIQPQVPEAEATARLLNRLILQSQVLLENHPVNRRRIAEGKDPANSIWPWSPGYRPQMQPLSHRFPQIRSGAVISAVDLIRGIGAYAGLRRIVVEGATGLYNTNYENKVAATLDALRTDDFVYLHIEASDEAGHEGNVNLKLRTIEDLDRRVVAPIYEEVSQWDQPVAIALLPDHPTPCELRTHTAEAVPFLIWHAGIQADSVQTYNEVAARAGSYGTLQGDQFMKAFMQ
ncbi:MAG: cofactor-independent phosphoglycerate mutase [Prevotellaceae bacterium]|jgi:2,3-bisphosphoglycerate-independent phosphoglycerate mutase|nr:cofactor-independent phosphoglycerate mutase [Prevotellaceae bacterium]